MSPAILSLNVTNPILVDRSSQGPDLRLALQELGPNRLGNMTEGDVEIQVVSVAVVPGVLNNTAIARESNDQLAAAIAASAYPDRFRAFAFLPIAQPDAAAQELERTVKQHGFLGALIDNHLDNGTFYDGPAYNVFWAKAQELDVPIYLHPTVPDSDSVFNINEGRYAPSGIPGDEVTYNYPLDEAASLATGAWGWHIDVGSHFLRLYAAGVFDAFPRLKLVLGHMGEGVPFMLERADGILSPQAVSRGRASLVEVWGRNIWVTTSGFFSTNTMATVLRNTAVDKIMFSVDYPYSSTAKAKRFMEDLKNSALVNETEWLAIARGNAENLLGIQ